MKQDSIWGAIFEHPNFAILVKRRRRLVSTLMLISMAVYFAIPLFSAYFPNFSLIRFMARSMSAWCIWSGNISSAPRSPFLCLALEEHRRDVRRPGFRSFFERQS